MPPRAPRHSDFPSNDVLRKRIKGIYLGTADMKKQLDWNWDNNLRRHVLTVKGDKTAANLHGIFKVAEHPYGLVPDGGFDKERKGYYATGWSDGVAMAKRNAWAYLIQVPNTTLLGHADFETYYANIRDIEELKRPTTAGDMLISSKTDAKISLRITHKMFSPKSAGITDASTSTNTEGNTSGVGGSRSTVDNSSNEPPLDPIFNIDQWPVTDANRVAVQQLVDMGTWETSPLPLFIEGVKGLVPPSEYATVLPGAIIQIAFTPVLSIVTEEGVKKQVFNTMLNEIIILKKGDVRSSLPSTPTKKRTLPREPSFSPKKRAEGVDNNKVDADKVHINIFHIKILKYLNWC